MGTAPAAGPTSAATPRSVGGVPLEVMLEQAEVRQRRLLDELADLTDAQARGPSLLPGWTRGHVVTHLARNADSQRRLLDGALLEQQVEQYAGGSAGRTAEIEAGAGRPAAALVRDLAEATDHVVATWARMTEEAWDRVTRARAGARPAWRSVWSRWRETELHRLDLDLGATLEEWPEPFVSAALASLVAGLERRLPNRTMLTVHATDTGEGWEVHRQRSAPEVAYEVRADRPTLVAWLTDRPWRPRPAPVIRRDGRPSDGPPLGPWA